MESYTKKAQQIEKKCRSFTNISNYSAIFWRLNKCIIL